jgi:hypothetical protein
MSSESYPTGTELTYYTSGSVQPSSTDTMKPATCVTVITDGNVFVTGGIGAGTIMKYVDWFILAGGKPLRVSTPIPELPVEETSPIGTKFKWSQGIETYRIAIQTAKGVLQVKSVTDGGGEVHPSTCRDCIPCRELAMTPPAPWTRRPLMKKMFADEAAWRASLPKGGFVTVTWPDTRSNAEKLAEDYNPYVDDRDRLNEYMRRFNIRSTVEEYTLSTEKKMLIKNPGATRLRAVIGETEYEVALCGTYPFQTSTIMRYIALHAIGIPSATTQLFNSIDEIRGKLGKPSFHILYRGSKIPLPNCQYSPPTAQCECRPDGFCCDDHLYT